MSNFKKIPGFDIYEANEAGVIRKITTKRVVRPYVTKFGYLRLVLYKDGVRHPKFVHSIVAETFIPKPNGDVEVNHKDGNRANPSVSNLEWVTRQENIAHARNILGADPNKMKKIPVRCLETGETFESIISAQARYGKRLHIKDVLDGKRNRAGGFHWEAI